MCLWILTTPQTAAMAPSPGNWGLPGRLIVQLSAALLWRWPSPILPPEIDLYGGGDSGARYGRLGRRARLAMTAALNEAWSAQAFEVDGNLCGGLWHTPRPAIKWRRCRRLFEAQRRCWCNRGRRVRHRCGWLGLRVGEASKPGPGSPGTPIHPAIVRAGARQRSTSPRSPRRQPPASPMDVDPAPAPRVYCPVAGCPCSDPARTAGWANHITIRSHIDAHLAGSLDGEVPVAWLQAQNRQRCAVCGLSVSVKHGVHPTCRPAARDAAGPRPGDVPVGAAGQWTPPSLEEIRSARTPTLRHVPAAARPAWSKALTRALAAAGHRNTAEAWRELLMLPRCVLGAPPRSGRKHRKAVAAYTRDRLHRWLEGERQGLWETRHEPPVRDKRQTSPADRREFATALVREGYERKACTALLSQGLCSQTAETAEALRALHPAQPAPQTPQLQSLPPAPDLEADVILKALRAFPAGTSPGPSGLRVQHLLDACVPGSADNVLEQLTAVVNLLAQGQACADIAPFLAGAALVAVPKPKGGVRPIAIGEVLRRLTGKCLLTKVKDDAKSFFWPVQMGVAVPAGAEVAVHTVRAYIREREPI